jgi:GntR family transcriptional repressor for pyruvate dehydrogenase complex
MATTSNSRNTGARKQQIASVGKPLGRKSVVKQVLDHFREALIKKELKPGDYLPSETELTESFGVGKTSIREAVKMLEAVGIVEVKQGHGTYIREKPAEDTLTPMIFQLIVDQGTHEQLIQLRELFEPGYMSLALQQATDEEIARIGESIDEFERKIEAGTQRAEDDLNFHYRILEATHNPFIIRIGRTVLQLFTASVTQSMRTIPDVALKDHRAIFRALEARDPNALEQAVQKSFEGWQQSLEAE